MTPSAPGHQQLNSPRASAAGAAMDTLRVSATALWILHREDAVRRGLAERVDIRGALLGDPRDTRRDDPAVPRAIVLGVSEDFEAELEFAYRMSERAPDLEWLVVARSEDLGEARRLFDTLPGATLDLESEADLLRAQIRSLLNHRKAPPLSERGRRSVLTERFSRWHADLASPALLAATDPKRVRVPVWIHGEPGTGRGVLARYLHQLATGVPAGPFVSVACAGIRDRASLLDAWSVESGEVPSGLLTTLCLEDVDHLPIPLREELGRWIEYGPPAGFVPGARLRWIATTEAAPQGRLREALAGLEVALPALRDDPERIEAQSREAARAWCEARELPQRELAPDAIERLRAHKWPGNLRELDTVLARSLAASSARHLGADSLLFEHSEEGEPDSVAEPRAPASGAPEPEVFATVSREDDTEGIQEADPWPSFDDTQESFASDHPVPTFLVDEESREDQSEVLLPTELEDRSETHDALLDVPEMAGAFGPGADESPSGAGSPDPIAAAAAPIVSPPRGAGVRRLASAIAHEIGNPLVGIRSFSQMLPRRYEDPEFRRVATERVAADTARIEAALETLTRLGQPDDQARESIDLSALIAGLLAERRGQIHERNLVVLEELDREHAFVDAQRASLHGALVSLLDAVFELLPERGDLYVATQGPGAGHTRESTTRAVLRFVSGDSAAPEGLSRAEQSLGIATATLLLESLGGQVVLDQSDAPTVLLLFELPAASDPGPSL